MAGWLAGWLDGWLAGWLAWRNWQFSPISSSPLRPYGCKRIPLYKTDSILLASESGPLAIHSHLATSCSVAWLGAGDWWLGTAGWGLRARAWLAPGLGLGWLVTVFGHWRFSWLTGWLSRKAWFSAKGLAQLVHGSLFGGW